MRSAPRRFTIPRKVLGGIAVAATVVALSVAGTTSAQAAGTVPFPGSQPKWATAAADDGAASFDTTVEGEVYLPLRDPAGAERLATIVSTPGVSAFRQGLSAAQWIARFSPTQATVNTVVSYLQSQGAVDIQIPASREYIAFRTPVSDTAAAFGTSIHSYSVAGTRLLAPSSAPTLPTAIAGLVSGVVLDQASLLTHPDHVKSTQDEPSVSTKLFATKSPSSTPSATTPDCAAYVGQYSVTVPVAYGSTKYNLGPCGYTPTQLRSAYGLSSLGRTSTLGAGQTIAIIDAYASPTIVSDANTFAAANGEPSLNGHYRQIVPAPSQLRDQEACGYASGWQTEQTLDVESAHSTAPGADILYVGGDNCGAGIDLALSTILDHNLSSIVSNSYSDFGEDLTSDEITGEQNLFLQAAGENIGLYYSSGDDGDNTDYGVPASANFPDTDPWVTSVGGTSIALDKNSNPIWETGWGSALDVVSGNGYTYPLPGEFAGGAGGGVSTVFAEPSYQRGIVPSSVANGMRAIPDISALADPETGFTIGYTPIIDGGDAGTDPSYGTVTYGGTSLASPVTASLIAIVQQRLHTTIGFANPTLYAVDRVVPSAFRDVPANTNPPKALVYIGSVSGNTFLITFGQDSSLSTARGWDDVTGIGEVSYGLMNLVGQGRH